MPEKQVNIFWFRRDLRIEDNHGLSRALQAGLPVLPLYIFDTNILYSLPGEDARVNYIHLVLSNIDKSFQAANSSLLVEAGDPPGVFERLIKAYSVSHVFYNEDYEPYAKARDKHIATLLHERGIGFHGHKDQLIFAPGEVLKDDGKPYTVYTPFMKRWKQRFRREMVLPNQSVSLKGKSAREAFPFPTLDELGFSPSPIKVPPYNLDKQLLENYSNTRNRPDWQGTTNLSTHLRFGTISVRKAVEKALAYSEEFLNELIWREFFAHVLHFFPDSATHNFRKGFDLFPWENDPDKIARWMSGITGFPLVDAGMRELVATGLMHNRVRMVTASFLVKDLLVDWRIGEAFFAKHLLDYEQSSNVGNWQWAAGTGCDAAPFFRIFNPVEQQKRFDPDFVYVRKWVPEFGTSSYPPPMINHAEARVRALEIYKSLRRG
ncbi:MAG: deoxyribodipyrimidine photo-lyase [Bacteroidales bacterium]